MNKIQIFVILANSILFSILNYPDEIAITYITIISFCIWMFCLKIKSLLEWTQTKFFHYAQFTLLFFSFFFIIQFKFPSNLMVSLSILFMLGIIYITIDILSYQEFIKIYATSTKDSHITCVNCGKNNKNPTSDICSECGESLTIKINIVKCINCHKNNKNPTSDVCSECGESLSIEVNMITCTNCDKNNKNPTSDICSECGESLSIKINIVKCINCRKGNKNPISDVCSECGESLSKKVKKVKCVNCGEKNKNPTTDLCTKCGKSLSNKSLTVKCTNCGLEFDSKESSCPYCSTQKV